MRFHTVPEPDWKVFRALREVALERFCRRVLEEIDSSRASGSRSHYERYIEIYRLVQRCDEELSNAFDNPRRSTMVVQLAAMHAHGLVEPEELARFRPEIRDTVEFLGKGSSG